MTQDEAEEAASDRKRQTFLAVRIFDTLKTPLGIVYMDAEGHNVFDDIAARAISEAKTQEQPDTGQYLDDIDDPLNVDRAQMLETEFQKLAERSGLIMSIVQLRESVGWEDERRLLFASAL